jgi:capsular polysaccharide biosynthesis protein/Mrp family chromosome partitioning ATPase
MTEDPVLLRHLRALRRHAWLIGLCVVGALGAAALFLATQHSVYRASMKILVGQGGGQFQPTNPGAFDPFTQTMADLLKSDVVATKVISDLNLQLTPRGLLSHLAVSTKPQTAVLGVSYDSTDRGAAVVILRQTGRVFARLVSQRLGGQTAGRGGAATTGPVSVTTFDPAHLEEGRVSPRRSWTFGLAALFALLIGTGLALARETMKPRIDSRDQAEEWFGAPVVGTLPKRSGQDFIPLELWSKGATKEASIVRALAPLTGQLQARNAAGDRMIVVTSAADNEGKSVLAAHLGAALTATGERVVCVEADETRPTVSSYLGGRAGANGSPHYGLIDSDGHVFARTSQRGRKLWVLPAPELRSDGAEALTSDALVGLMRTLTSSDRCVIVDAPPLLLSPSALTLTLAADTILVAVHRGSTTKAEAEMVRSLLATAEGKRIGLVLCDRDSHFRVFRAGWLRSAVRVAGLARSSEHVPGKQRAVPPRVQAPPPDSRRASPREDRAG